MKIIIYGGRVGQGTEWSEEFDFNEDSTIEDINYFACGLSEDFIEETLAYAPDMYDFWYEWEEEKIEYTNKE